MLVIKRELKNIKVLLCFVLRPYLNVLFQLDRNNFFKQKKKTQNKTKNNVAKNVVQDTEGWVLFQN